MLKKFLLAAGLAAAFTLSAQIAEAKVKVFIGIGGYPGGYCNDHYDPYRCGDRGDYGNYPDYGYGGGYYPVVDPYYGGGISCNKGRKIVKWAGFYNVSPIDCSYPVYQYQAWKYGNPYKVKVNMSGDIIKVKPLY